MLSSDICLCKQCSWKWRHSEIKYIYFLFLNIFFQRLEILAPLRTVYSVSSTPAVSILRHSRAHVSLQAPWIFLLTVPLASHGPRVLFELISFLWWCVWWFEEAAQLAKPCLHIHTRCWKVKEHSIVNNTEVFEWLSSFYREKKKSQMWVKYKNTGNYVCPWNLWIRVSTGNWITHVKAGLDLRDKK